MCPKGFEKFNMIGHERGFPEVMASQGTHALSFKILAECSTTKARASFMKLPHATVDTPVFMPVGTQGTLKGLVPDELRELDCRIILGNTYHLGHRPVCIRNLWLDN